MNNQLYKEINEGIQEYISANYSWDVEYPLRILYTDICTYFYYDRDESCHNEQDLRRVVRNRILKNLPYLDREELMEIQVLRLLDYDNQEDLWSDPVCNWVARHSYWRWELFWDGCRRDGTALVK